MPMLQCAPLSISVYLLEYLKHQVGHWVHKNQYFPFQLQIPNILLFIPFCQAEKIWQFIVTVKNSETILLRNKLKIISTHELWSLSLLYHVFIILPLPFHIRLVVSKTETFKNIQIFSASHWQQWCYHDSEHFGTCCWGQFPSQARKSFLLSWVYQTFILPMARTSLLCLSSLQFYPVLLTLWLISHRKTIQLGSWQVRLEAKDRGEALKQSEKVGCRREEAIA